MRILVTLGSTFSPIDSNKHISNVYNFGIGEEFIEKVFAEKCEITVLTSRPFCFDNKSGAIFTREFSSYNDFISLMEYEVSFKKYDAIFHFASVNGYEVRRKFAKQSEQETDNNKSIMKLKQPVQKTDKGTIILELIPVENFVPLIRSKWNFGGYLVVSTNDKDCISDFSSVANVVMVNNSPDFFLYGIAKEGEDMSNWVSKQELIASIMLPLSSSR